MQTLKYLNSIIDNEKRFGIILNDIALKHNEQIQLKMALNLLEFFNSGKFVDENDIKKEGNMFYVLKEQYFNSKL